MYKDNGVSDATKKLPLYNEYVTENELKASYIYGWFRPVVVWELYCDEIEK